MLANENPRRVAGITPYALIWSVNTNPGPGNQVVVRGYQFCRRCRSIIVTMRADNAREIRILYYNNNNIYLPIRRNYLENSPCKKMLYCNKVAA